MLGMRFARLLSWWPIRRLPLRNLPAPLPHHIPPHAPAGGRRSRPARLAAGRTPAARVGPGRTSTRKTPTTQGGTAMPVGTANGTRKHTKPPGWYTQISDALKNAERQYNPELAMQCVAVMDWLPDLQLQVAQFYKHLGAKSVQMVDLPPSTAQFFGELGNQQQRQASALRTAMQAAKQAVMDRIERIVRARQQDIAWDVKIHQGADW
jgi:hypothetical protein